MKEKILSIIEKNSRISIEDLAIVLGEKAEEVAQAIFELEQDHIICGYHTLINWNNTNREDVYKRQDETETGKDDYTGDVDE